MKNSPDPEWYHKLEKRLGDYTEVPDGEVWNKISAAIRKDPELVWVSRVHRATAVFIAVLFSLTAIQQARFGGVRSDDGAHGLPVPTADEAAAALENEEVGSSWHVLKPLRVVGGDASHTESEIRANQPLSDGENVHYTPELLRSQLIAKSKEGTHPLASTDSLSFLAVDTHETPALKEGIVIPDRKRRMVTLYAGIMPLLTFQKFTPHSKDGVVVEGFHTRPVFSANRSGISVQAGFQLELAKRLEVYGGLMVYHQSQLVTYQYLTDVPSEITRHEEFDYSILPKAVEKTVRYAMFNLGVEAGMIYLLRGDRLTHKIGAGFSFQHGLRRIKPGESYDNAESQYLSYQLFYRNEYTVNSSFNIFVQPFYANALLTREALDEPFRIKPYHAGLNVGILYKLP